MWDFRRRAFPTSAHACADVSHHQDKFPLPRYELNTTRYLTPATIDELKDSIVLPDGWRNHGSDDLPMSQGACLLPLNEGADTFLIKYSPSARITKVVGKINLIFWEKVLSPRKRPEEVGVGRSAESVRFISPGTKDNLWPGRLASRNTSKLLKRKEVCRQVGKDDT